jgi:hypothetical protein
MPPGDQQVMQKPKCPMHFTSKIKSAGRFPMSTSNSGRDYFHYEVAAHQHLYADTILIERNACHANDGEIK